LQHKVCAIATALYVIVEIVGGRSDVIADLQVFLAMTAVFCCLEMNKGAVELRLTCVSFVQRHDFAEVSTFSVRWHNAC
jgi:hypothetical protein